MTRPTPLLGIALFLVADVAGCKPKEPPSNPSGPSAPVAPASGKWTLASDKETVVNDASGAQVTVPAGAVGENKELTLTSEPPEAQPGAVGRVVDLGIVGEAHYRFKKPIRLSLPFNPALVGSGEEVVVSRWDSGRWQKIRDSHVEGDHAVAEIDHFSKYAATKRAKSTKEPSRPRHPLLEVGGWDVQIDIEMSGEWSKREVNYQSMGKLSRSGSVHFQLSTWHVDADNKDAFWGTPHKNWPPEDETRVTWSLSDFSMHTDNDQDKTGNVFYYSTSEGSGSGRKHEINSLKIDAVKGTWSLSGGSVSAGKTMRREWDSFGRSESPMGAAVSVNYHAITQPLPAEGQPLTHTVKLTKENYGWISSDFPGPNVKQVEGQAVITLTPLGGVLARIKPPDEFLRGDEVTLDASESLGNVASTHWKVTVDPSCPDAPEPMEHDGPTWKFRALWTFKAELEITSKDGKKSETARRFRAQPRRGKEWTLQFKTRAAADLDRPMKVEWLQFGINQCDKEKQDVESGHKIHSISAATKGETMTWVNGAYAIVQVRDDGPFKGMYYTDQPNFLVDRVERVNKDLAPGGAVAKLNTKAGNQAQIERLNKILKEDPENTTALNQKALASAHQEGDAGKLFNQAKDHEAIHSTLMQRAYAILLGNGKDPGPLVERVVSANEATVQDKSDGHIRPAETDLFEATDDAKVKAELETLKKYKGYVHLWFPKGTKDFEYIELGPLWSLGDEQK